MKIRCFSSLFFYWSMMNDRFVATPGTVEWQKSIALADCPYRYLTNNNSMQSEGQRFHGIVVIDINRLVCFLHEVFDLDGNMSWGHFLVTILIFMANLTHVLIELSPVIFLVFGML